MLKTIRLPHKLYLLTLLWVSLIVFVSINFLNVFGNSNTATVQAATNSTINFQARLLTSSGNTVPDGNYHVEFKLFDASSSSGSSQGSCTGDSDCLWTETRTTGNLVRVVNGYLSVNLGSVTAFPTTIDWDQEHWLSINIGGNSGSASWDGQMTPRLKLTGVPYAFRAGKLVDNDSGNQGLLEFDTLTDDRSILLPDESGTVCLQNSSSCGFVETGDFTLQGAYDGGNTIATTDGNDIGITLSNTTTDANFIIDIATGSGGQFQIESNGTDVLQIGSSGQLQLDVQGSSGGIVIGTDTLLYRGGADLLQTPDDLTSAGTITAALFSGSGASLTNLDASNLSSGTVPSARISGSYTGITGVGALDAGSITSNFGSINNGSSSITTSGTIQGGTVNATSAIQLGGTNINTAGTLSNVAYQNQSNTFTQSQTISAGGGKTTLELSSTGANTGITLGGDTTLFRASANTLETDDSFVISGDQFTNNASTLNTAQALGDFPAGGAIGTAATTVDVDTSFAVGQTTAGQVLNLPDPTSTVAGRIVFVLNTGSVSFTMHSVTIPAGYGQIYIWNGSSWILGASGGGSAITLQAAYDGGETLTTSDGRNIDITLANTTTDANLTIDIATGSTGEFQVESNGTDVLQIGATGQLQLDVQGSSGGLLLGGDTNLYRGAADTLQTDSEFHINQNSLTIERSGTSNGAIHINTSADTDYRIEIFAGGEINWGNGTNSPDTNLYRDGANILRTDDSFWADWININGGATDAWLNIQGASGDPTIRTYDDSNVRVFSVAYDGTLSWGDTGDTNLYRSGANILATDDIFEVGTLGSADSDTVLCRNSSDQIATCSSTFASSADITLQNAYDTGNTILTTDGNDIDITLANTTTDASFTIDIATGSTGRFAVQAAGTDTFSIGSTGAALFQNSTNSTTAFQVQNAAGTSVFTVDTSNQRVGIGAAPLAGYELYVQSNSDATLRARNIGSANILELANNSSTVATVNNAGQLQLAVQGDTGGILLGGDANLYRDSADVLKTDSSFIVQDAATDAFQVQNGTGTAILNVDTSNALVEVDDGNGASGESYVTFNNRVSIGYDGDNFDDAVIIGHTDKGIRFFVDNTVNALTLSDEGHATFQNGTNSTTAFQIQASNADPLLIADTTNMTLSVRADATQSADILRVEASDGTAYVSVGSSGGILSRRTGTGPTTSAFAARGLSDSANRINIQAGGTIEWGDGSSAVDTNLYRGAANTLQTDSNFIGNNTSEGTSTTTTASGTNATFAGVVSSTGFAANDIVFIDNSGQDYYARLTFAGSNIFIFDQEVSFDNGATITKRNSQSLGGLPSDYSDSYKLFEGVFGGRVVVGAGTNPANLTMLGNGRLDFGSDTNLYRSAANTLTTDDALNVSSTLNVGSTLTIGTVNSTGTLLVLDTKNTLSDPTCVNGGMYYNSASSQAKICINSSWAAVGVPTVTSLPASPANGDEVYYEVDRGDGTDAYWHLRYNSSSTYWDFMGGTNEHVLSGSNPTTSSTTYQTSGSPSITLPLDGDYYVSYGSRQVISQVSGDNSMQVALYSNGSEASSMFIRGSVHHGSPAYHKKLLTGLTSGNALNTRYRSASGSSTQFWGLFVDIIPVRVQ